MTPTSFKTLHTFTVSIDKEVTKTTTREENGQKITVESKSVESVPHTVVLKEPSRRERQDLSLFQGVMYNEAITKGLLPKVVMQQKVGKDANSPLSEDEDKNLTVLNARLQELSQDYLRLNGEPVTDEVNARKERLLVEYGTLYKKIIDLNTAYQSVYAYTAENYMQVKTLAWLSLFLTYLRTAPEAAPTPFFTGSDFNAKEERAGDMEDSGDALLKAALKDDKLPRYWQLYLFNRASKPEDFARIDEEDARHAAAMAKMKEEADKAKVVAPASPVEAPASKVEALEETAPVLV